MGDKKIISAPQGDEAEFYKQVGKLLLAARQYEKVGHNDCNSCYEIV